MEKEFVSYELAIKLEELGFDEPCCGFYDHMIKEIDTISADACERLCKHHTHIKAPTWQSAFRWFREKHRLSHIWIMDELLDAGEYTYEEAELACLTKLIEIVEQKEK
jgi:hypothetical protein